MKHLHFIGICGVAMSALATAFKKAGYKVTGSDVGFYPPVSTMLEKSGVNFYPGWHPEKMGVPDLVIVGNVASSTNPEWAAVQEKKIPYKSYPEAIAEFWLKDNSIVCAGTYGKTTTSALLAWIFSRAGLDPSYMFGGLAIGDFPSANLGGNTWSILEGDEYKSARWDDKPKFAHYKPKYLLLTAVTWDHADVYPTEASYFDAFKNLVNQIPADGLIVVCGNDAKAIKIAAESKSKIITYGKNNAVDYQLSGIEETKNGLVFVIQHDGKKYTVESPLLGSYQAENITGAFAMAQELKIDPTIIVAALKNFPGLKRRLEKRFEGDVTVIDDIAHSPTKAKFVLETLRKTYSGKIIAVFEPNTGNRKPDIKKLYDNAFAAADEVIIPRLTKVKVDPADLALPFEGEELAATIAKTHANVKYIDDDRALIGHLTTAANTDDVIVFLGSHGFRGMIEGLIAKF